MIDLSIVQPPATRRHFALQVIACVLMLCVALQSLFFPGLRIADRAHFHIVLSSAHSEHGHDGGDEDWHAQDERGAGGAANAVRPHTSVGTHAGHGAHGHTHEHIHARQHGHAHIAHHDHAEGRADVVYVNADHPASPSGPAPNRVALDVDGLMLHRIASRADVPAGMPFPLLQSSFRTRDEPPLERPPRASA